MPLPALRTLARRARRSPRRAEAYWAEARRTARRRGIYKKDGEARYWRYVTGVVKRRLGLR